MSRIEQAEKMESNVSKSAAPLVLNTEDMNGHPNVFQPRIEELTESFKGRTQERGTLLRFVREKHKGYCSIQGSPGIGKSALIAQFFKDRSDIRTDIRAVWDLLHTPLTINLINPTTTKHGTTPQQGSEVPGGASAGHLRIDGGRRDQ